jgi:flagellar hook-basal body complex protein FliE
MDILSTKMVTGDLVGIKATDPRHFKGAEVENVEKSFSSHLSDALNNVNDSIHESEALTEAFLVDPESVDVHDVTISLAKANMGVSLTKSVVDGALKAYREIINMR